MGVTIPNRWPLTTEILNEEGTRALVAAFDVAALATTKPQAVTAVTAAAAARTRRGHGVGRRDGGILLRGHRGGRGFTPLR